MISIQQEEYDQGKAVRSELRRLTVEQETLSPDGTGHFSGLWSPCHWNSRRKRFAIVMIAYDAEGRIAAEFDIECCTYSGYG